MSSSFLRFGPEGPRRSTSGALLPALVTSGLVLVAIFACSDMSDESGSDGAGGATSGPGVGVGDGDGSTPPEEELEENFRAPVVAGPYLFSANPETNRVALIDARSLRTTVIDAGHGPTYLAGLPAGTTLGGALVINALGGDASFFELSDLDAPTGPTVTEERIVVQPGASGWAVSRGGRFAIAWSRVTDGLLGPTDGYQDITIMTMADEPVSTTRLAVGFRPTRVTFNDAETRAYVVSDPGLSVIDLEGDSPEIAREIFLPEQVPGTGRDVTVTPDGRLAFVRVGGTAEVLVIDTETEETVEIQLPRVVTDLDLSGDGSLALAVMRGVAPVGEVEPGVGGEGGMGGTAAGTGGSGGGAGSAGEQSLVALLDVAAIFEAPDTYQLLATDEVVGSLVVADDASYALLFTNATPSSRLSVLDIEAEKFRVVDLKAPARAAFISPEGSSGVVLMSPPATSTRGGAFALVPVAKATSPRIEGCATEPKYVSLTEERAFITTAGGAPTGGDAAAEAFLGRFPELTVDQVVLPSTPLSSGLVPEANQGFVSQEHPEGRITFVDMDSAEARTKTGFELASEVKQ